MASVPEQRNIIVQQNIPKLIKSLTGLKYTDENFKTCVQFCYSHFKYHRFLSVNSHEVKRDIDGIGEKLRFSNFHDLEGKFRKMVQSSITHELCVDHYEKDAIYAILSLLISLAYDPINNLKAKLLKGEDIIAFKAAPAITPRKASKTFISELRKDNFKLLKNETDSELSEWTDSDDESQEEESQATDDTQVSPSKAVGSSLKPPRKPNVFTTKKIETPEKWLRENLQHSWWSSDVTTCEINSKHPAANFCRNWQKHLSDKSLGFIKPRQVSLVSEYCLLREILWMFMNPVDCKFFKFQGDEIVLRPDVTLPSTMPESLQIFLNDFVRPINLMNHLKSACLKSYQSSSLPHTLETFFKVTQNILDRVTKFILEEETTIKAQQETYTIMTLHNKLRPHAKMLEMIWDIYSSSVLDEAKYPPHICATYLLASLNLHVKTSCLKEKKSLAVVLLLACAKTFLEIFDVWWTEARLDDLKSEFLMEKNHESEVETFQPRLLVKSKEKSFYLNDGISTKITADSLVNVMLSYAVKASFTLDIISKLDRVHEMRQTVDDTISLYDEFSKKINREIQRFSDKKEDAEVPEAKIDKEVSEASEKNKKLVEDIRNRMLENGDDDLLLAFQSTFDQITEEKPFEATEPSPMEFYDSLNSATSFLLLPLEHSIQRIINELLNKKISISERFVMKIYFHEFHVEQHLHEVRRVFFLESNELINFFYEKLFPLMEAGESWANPYLLTVALNDAICSNRQQSSMIFSVEVKRKLGHNSVLYAVDDLTLVFNVNQNFSSFFTAQTMKKYNEVFRFLLKIKWGQRILNCLQFPNFFRHRTPYAKLKLIDLVIKRLSLTRFAMQHSINSLHNHLMVMLQTLSLQLDVQVAKSKNISELVSHHIAFVDAFHKRSFLSAESSRVYGIIIELLKLALVLKDEWSNITTFAELDAAGTITDSTSLCGFNSNTLQIEKAFGFCEYQLKIMLDL